MYAPVRILAVNHPILMTFGAQMHILTAEIILNSETTTASTLECAQRDVNQIRKLYFNSFLMKELLLTITRKRC